MGGRADQGPSAACTGPGAEAGRSLARSISLQRGQLTLLRVVQCAVQSSTPQRMRAWVRRSGG